MFKLICSTFFVKNIIYDNHIEFNNQDEYYNYINKVIEQRNILFTELFSVVGIIIGLLYVFFNLPLFVIGFFFITLIIITLFIIAPENKIILSDNFYKGLIKDDK